jgi:hypothetical protein
MSKNRDNPFVSMSYMELLENYTNFSRSIPTGGNRSGGKKDAMLLRDMEAEIRRREQIGDTGGTAELSLGGAKAVVVVKSPK